MTPQDPNPDQPPTSPQPEPAAGGAVIALLITHINATKKKTRR